MNDDLDDLDFSGSGEMKTVDLSYHIYTDESGMIAYVKFEGFKNTDEVKEFADFMDENLPLLLFNSDVKH